MFSPSVNVGIFIMEIKSTQVYELAMKKVSNILIERESHPARVGPRVTAIRATLELSKAAFADSVELDRSSLTKIEKGEAGLDIAVSERLANLYGFGLDFVYRGDLDDVPLSLRANLVRNLAIARSK